MSGSYFFFGLMQLIIAISWQPAWGTVLVAPPEVAIGAYNVPANLTPADAVCCDQSFKDTSPESKIIVAQVLDLITGAAKLIYYATDNTKEKEEAAKAAELQKLSEEKAKTEEQNKILKAKELDELKRQNLSNPFDVADTPPAIEKPIPETGKKQLVDIPPAGATGNSPTPTTNSQNSGSKEVAATSSQQTPGTVAVEQTQVAASAVQVTGNVAQAVTSSGQTAAVGPNVAVPISQAITQVEPVATSAGASTTPATHSSALVDQVANSAGQIPTLNGQVMVPVTQQATLPAGQLISPPVQLAAPVIQAVAVGQIPTQAQTPSIQTPVSATQASTLNNSQIVDPVAQAAAPVEQVVSAINGVGAQARQVANTVGNGAASGGQNTAMVAPFVSTASVVPATVNNVAVQEGLQKNLTTGQVAVQDSLPNKSVPSGNADTEKTAISLHAIQPEKISLPVDSSAAPLKKSDNPFEN